MAAFANFKTFAQALRCLQSSDPRRTQAESNAGLRVTKHRNALFAGGFTKAWLCTSPGPGIQSPNQHELKSRICSFRCSWLPLIQSPSVTKHLGNYYRYFKQTVILYSSISVYIYIYYIHMRYHMFVYTWYTHIHYHTIALHCIALHCIALHCSALNYITYIHEYTG